MSVHEQRALRVRSYLRLGLTSHVKLADAQRHQTSRLVAAAPWYAVATRVEDAVELAEMFDHRDGGLIDLKETESLAHSWRRKKQLRLGTIEQVTLFNATYFPRVSARILVVLLSRILNGAL